MPSFAYPMALELSGHRAVVVGTAAVALGKVDALVAAGANVTVVAEEPEERLRLLDHEPNVTIVRRAFAPEDLDGAFVCVASSPDADEREHIHRAGRERRVLMNLVDDVARSDFAAPAVVRRGDLLIAISTGGASPALAGRLREELAARFGPEWGEIVDVLREVRRQTLRSLPAHPERPKRWREGLDLDEAERLVRGGRREELKARLVARLLGTEEVA